MEKIETLLGLIGDKNALSSLSPFIHSHYAKSCGIEIPEYNIFAINSSSEMTSFFKNAELYQFVFLNVTSPYKTLIHQILDLEYENKMAEKISTINTLKFNGFNWKAINTDFLAITELLKKHNPTHDKIKSFLIIGSGGMARAFAAAAVAFCNKPLIHFLSRSEEKALEIAKSLEIEVKHIYNASQLSLTNYDCIMNSISIECDTVDSVVNSIEKEIKELLMRNTLFMNAPYINKEEAITKALREYKINSENGLDILLSQAKFSFEYWFGKIPIELDLKRLFFEQQLKQSYAPSLFKSDK